MKKMKNWIPGAVLIGLSGFFVSSANATTLYEMTLRACVEQVCGNRDCSGNRSLYEETRRDCAASDRRIVLFCPATFRLESTLRGYRNFVGTDDATSFWCDLTGEMDGYLSFYSCKSHPWNVDRAIPYADLQIRASSRQQIRNGTFNVRVGYDNTAPRNNRTFVARPRNLNCSATVYVR